MSQRHRSPEAAPPPKMDLRAHAHNERHRINAELHAVAVQVSAGEPPEDLHEPGRGWIPGHHREAERVAEASRPKSTRHWKLKMWKRRSKLRLAKAKAFHVTARQA